jgi:hypothetical protein
MWSAEYERRAPEMRERNQGARYASGSIYGHSPTNDALANTPAMEPHYTAKEIALLWKLSTSSIINIFRDEPGVLKIGHDRPRRRRRSYTTLRIPHSIVERVYRRMLVR